MNGADAADRGGAAVRRAIALAVTVLCLLMIRHLAEAGFSTPMPWAAALFVAVLFVLALAYVVPGTRHWWARHRCGCWRCRGW